MGDPDSVRRVSGEFRLACCRTEDANFSRFQLLIFTFVIALSYFLLAIGEMSKNLSDSTSYASDLLGNVLTLLGISGGSYALSKGIRKTA
jgi:hypothetical protein